MSNNNNRRLKSTSCLNVFFGFLYDCILFARKDDDDDDVATDRRNLIFLSSSFKVLFMHQNITTDALQTIQSFKSDDALLLYVQN